MPSRKILPTLLMRAKSPYLHRDILFLLCKDSGNIINFVMFLHNKHPKKGTKRLMLACCTFVSTPFSLKYLLKLQIKLFFVSLQFK